MRMKMILCMSLLAVSCLCGCSQNEKVSLSETYDSENISAINMQIDSWQLKIMYEKKLLDGIGIYRTLFHRQTVCGYVRQTAVFIPYQRYIQSFRLSYNDYGKKNGEYPCVAAFRCVTLLYRRQI